MDNTQAFTVRVVTSIEELEQVEDLQKICLENQLNRIPLRTLINYARHGGRVLAAFDGDLMVGYLIAFLGTASRDPKRPAMTSLKLILENIGVHPDYRSNGIATRLGISLHEWCNQQGIRLVTSVFNPLDSRTAYLLIRKLGMMAKRWLQDYYPASSLIENSDQFLAEWWVTANRVEERLHGQRNNLTLAQYKNADVPVVNPGTFNEGLLHPYEGSFVFEQHAMLLVEIPIDYDTIALTHQDLAGAWQTHIRSVLQSMYLHGYVATDFLYEESDNHLRGLYLMSYDGPGFTIDT